MVNRRSLLKSIFVAPIAALLGTKIVSESTPIPNTNFAADSLRDEIEFLMSEMNQLSGVSCQYIGGRWRIEGSGADGSSIAYRRAE